MQMWRNVSRGMKYAKHTRRFQQQLPYTLGSSLSYHGAVTHADYAGPFMGKMFLLIMDAHSKWLEAHIVESATSAATIQKMKASFASHGLPVTLVTDNGSVFTSQEFEDFLTKNGIRHKDFSLPPSF